MKPITSSKAPLIMFNLYLYIIIQYTLFFGGSHLREHEADGLLEGEQHGVALRLQLLGPVAQPLEAGEGLLKAEALRLRHRRQQL
eukprot:506704-Prorocentrum_minimum.AAC.3